MKLFEVGKTYTHGWAGDADLHTSWTVTARTAKTITIKHNDEVKKLRIIAGLSEMLKAESVYPYGQYSMSPILSADKEG